MSMGPQLHDGRTGSARGRIPLCASLVALFLLPVWAEAAFPGAAGKIAFVRDSEIYVMNADGTGQTNLTNNSALDSSPAWSPDGTKIAFMSRRDNDDEIYVMNADGTGVTRLAANLGHDGEPSWSPDGSKIAFTSLRGGGGLNIFVMNADGTGVTQVTATYQGSYGGSMPAWSPDGAKIAFSGGTGGTGNSEIYVMNADGSGQTRLTNNPGNKEFANWSPDGTRIAFDNFSDGEIYVMNADGTAQTRLTNNPASERDPAFSPDGTDIVFRSNRDGNTEIYVMNADGSGQTRLTNDPFEDTYADWQPIPGRIPSAEFASDGNTVLLWHLNEGSGSTAADSSGNGRNGTIGGAPAWVPGRFSNGLSFAGGGPASQYVTIPDSDALTGSLMSIEVWIKPSRLDVGNRMIVFSPNTDYHLQLINPGNTLRFHNEGGSGTALTTTLPYPDTWYHITAVANGADSRLYVNGTLAARGVLLGAPAHRPGLLVIGGCTIGDRCAPNDNSFAGVIDDVRISNVARPLPPPGKIAFTSARDGNLDIFLMDADGTNERQLTFTASGWGSAHPDWSPDGTKIAFTSTGSDGNYDIYIMNADGTGVTRLTSHTAADMHPAWSPDGTKIAFDSTRDDFNGDIYVMNADGSSVARLASHAAADLYPAWAPDGTRIAFTSARNGVNFNTYVMNADGTNVIALSICDNTSSPAWSPDGTKIAFKRNNEIYMMNADGSNQVRLTNNAPESAAPAWSPDGRRIVFQTRRDGNDEIYSVEIDTTFQTRLTLNPAIDAEPSWQPTPGVIAFASPTYAVAEGQTASVTVSRTLSTFGPVTVPYTVSSGTATSPADFTATSGTLTFASGEAIKTISIPTVPDGLVEANETLVVALGSPTGVATLGTPSTATVTIIDGSAPAPKLSIGDVTLTEGNVGVKNASFAVSLSGPSGSAVTVNYATANVSASAGSDYTPVTGILTFVPGTTTATVNVPILGDSQVEPDENFTMTLSNQSANAMIAGGGTSGGLGWSQSSPTGTAPSARDNVSSAYDEFNDRLIVFGGDSPTRGNEVWVLANATQTGAASNWQQLSPSGAAPAARAADGVSYDPSTNRLIVHGGCDASCTDFSDVWVLTNANGMGGTPAWTQLSPTGTPRVSRGHVQGYDARSNRMVVFGGWSKNDTWVLVDANGIGSPAWTQLSPLGTPPATPYLAAGAYDPGSNRLIVFGGYTGNGLSILINANGLGGTPQWIQFSTPGAPQARYAHSMVYDARTKRAVVFGGFNGSYFNDVWLLTNADATTGSPQWIQASPSGGPPPTRASLALGYSGATDRMVIALGGNLSKLGDVWVLTNATGQNVGDGQGQGTILNDDSAGGSSLDQLVASGTAPVARHAHTAVADETNKRMVLFGGSIITTPTTLLRDVWVLTGADGIGAGATWAQLNPTGTAPAARARHSAVYDAAGNRMVVFGGDLALASCTPALNDVWVLTNANGLGGTPAWMQMSPLGTSPPVRESHSAVYDGANHRMIVFGGFQPCGGDLNDVWVLANADGVGGTPTWTQLSPGGPIPAGRGPQTAGYDVANNRMIVFGGGPTGLRNDVYVLTNANGLGGTPTWVPLSPTGTLPSARGHHQTLYDAAANRLLVFFGVDASGRLNDIWALSNANGLGGAPVWSQLSPSGTIPARADASAIYSPASRRATLFGGFNCASGTCSVLGDLWVFAESLATDTLQFSTASYSLAENGGSATITVTRSGSGSGQLTVNYATSDGSATNLPPNSDYTSASGTLTFNAGETFKTFNVSILTDAIAEPNETINLTLSNATGGAALGSPSTATLTIVDGTTPTVSINDVSVTEGDAGTKLATFTVTLSVASASPVSMTYSTSNGTATAGSDYTAVPSGSLTIPAFGLSAPLSITIIGDTAIESDETFLVTLSGITGANAGDVQGQGTIVNDDFPLTGNWSTLKSLARGHSRHTATLLLDAKVLVAGGDDSGGTTELFDPATGLWTTKGPLVQNRSAHTSTLLPNGKLLVMGGLVGGASAGSAELYDPATGVWTATGSMFYARHSHTATLLRNGKVLVVGGFATLSNSSLTSAELYNPQTGTWTTTGVGELQLGTRQDHVAVLLANGKVLVAAGSGKTGGSSGARTTAELFDPTTGFWSLAAPLDSARTRALGATATLLADGRVLLVGGQTGAGTATHALADLYTPDAGVGSWTPANALSSSRQSHSATLLPSGRVLVVGGYDVGSGLLRASAESFDPVSGVWAAVGSLTTSRRFHTTTLLPQGQVLVAGGSAASPLRSAEVFDPAAGGWSGTGTLGAARTEHTLTLLPSGKALAVGGMGAPPLGTAELYEPAAGSWSATGSLQQGRRAHAATLLATGKVLVVGGRDAFGVLKSCELYDPGTGLWTSSGDMSAPRYDHRVTMLPTGKVLVTGGQTSGGLYLSSAEIYDPATGTWSPAAPMRRQRYGHTATLLTNGNVLVSGGFDTVSVASAEIYELATGTWRETGPLNVDRQFHSATLLQNGNVLAAGGVGSDASARLSSEVFDPATEEWTSTTTPPTVGRETASATVLPNGSVLVVGGTSGSPSSVGEVFDPGSGKWRTASGMTTARWAPTAVLLGTGKVLVAGGGGITSELFDLASYPDSRRPVIQSVTGTIAYGLPLSVTGTGFRGDSEASGGGTNSSAVNYPLLQLRSLHNGRVTWLVPDARTNFSDEPMTLTFSSLPTVDQGHHHVTVYVDGIPSVSAASGVTCSLAITQHPASVVAPIASTATFSVSAQGALGYQWYRNDVAIPGATGARYTTPPLTAPDSASVYRAVVSGRCSSLTSTPATLTILDLVAPTVSVRSPVGGEYWLLSPADAPPLTRLVSWTMSDNVRICRVEASLLFSTNGGNTYQQAPVGGGLPASFGAGGTCPAPGVDTTSVTYSVPVTPPSGVTGSLYKVKVKAIDHAGLPTIATSGPFYMVQSNPDTVRTLILSNVARMQARMNLSPDQAGALAALPSKLQELAAHPRVQGIVADLASDLSISALYAAWDADQADANKANAVLFGCHPATVGGPLPSYCAAVQDGIHDRLLELLAIYTGVKYLILVGDDRIFPFARLTDRTYLLLESRYTDLPGSPLRPNVTTVGQALHDNKYLSDDPLAIVDPVRTDQLAGRLYVPDLAVGRLVETPNEITTSVATFISQDGVLDLSAPALNAKTGHKVLVTGYDFLTDTAKQIGKRWKTAACSVLPTQAERVACVNAALAPVDGSLTSNGDWTANVANRAAELRFHLAGDEDRDGVVAPTEARDTRYGVMSLNGHATHYQEGVPGSGPFNITGLSAVDLYGPDACGTSSAGALNLAGGVVYAVGCHGGLPVPGSCGASTDPDHSLDLPQTFLSRGVVAYVANTGFGWGLKHGIGYGERLVQLLTEEMTKGGTVVTGEAVKRTKQRYYLESPRHDPYDEKTLMQWTFFGMPMYAVKTGIGTSVSGDEAPSEALPAQARPAEESFGDVRVERKQSEAGEHSGAAAAAAPLPSYLTQLNLRFDFTGAGVYTKRDSSGNTSVENPALNASGCPDANGCYYTLNGLVERSSGMTDLPVQPYFIYDSRLSGTSQHGVLWKGGVYDQESGWVPVFATLQSNEDTSTDHGPLPEEITIDPFTPRLVPGKDPDGCRVSDLELNSLVVTAGESMKDQGTGTYAIQRKYREIELEAFYFNNTSLAADNCDRTGPSLGTGVYGGSYHRVTSSTVEWGVPATDPSEVWRVVVVYNTNQLTNQLDGSKRGRWEPLDLTNDAGVWRGSLTFSGTTDVTYVLQAVDKRGNVTWLRYQNATLPASGVAPGIPLPVHAALTPYQGSLSINDVTVTEGNAGAVIASFTVTLAPQAPTTVTVQYTTTNGTATAGSDYAAASGTLTFAPGETTKVVTVVVIGDAAVEASETFFVNLSNATGGASIGDNLGIGTITNDDLSALSINDVAVTEGNAGTVNATFTVTLSPAVGGTVTVLYATANGTAAAGVDYTSASGTLTFSAGQTTKTVSVPVIGDSTVEGDETFFVNLSSASGASIQDGQGEGTIANDDLPCLSIDDVSVTEGDVGSVNANFTVTLSPASSGTVTVQYATANGTATAGSDYNSTSGTLTFAAGETTKTISVPVLGDTVDEENETFNLSLSNPIGAVTCDPVGIGTILDNDLPPSGLSASPSCVVSTGSRTATVSLVAGPGHPGDWIGLYPQGSSSYVDWWYLNGTKTQPGTGLTNASFNVTMPATLGDYNFKLIGGATGSFVFTSNMVSVATSCGPSLSINDVSVTEVDSGSINANFTVMLSPAATGTVTVQYTTVNGTATAGSDYTTTSGTLTFAASETSKMISVPVLGDTAVEGNETYTVTLSNATGGATIADGSGAGTIVDNEVPPTGLSASPSCVVSTGTRIVSVTVAGGPGHTGDWVGFYPSAGGSYTDWWYLNGTKSAPGTGLANTTFNVTVPAALGTFNFKLIGGGTGSVVFTSNLVTVATSCGPPTPALSINDMSVTEGDSGSINANFTVTLSPAAAGTVTVDYTTVNGTATAGSDYTTTSGTLTFAASETTKTISVPVLGDTAVEGNETYTVTLSNATGGATIADGSGAGTIVDNEVPPTGLSASPSCVVSTGARTVAVTVAGGPGHTGDWVGFYPSAGGSYTDWWYLNGTKAAPGTGLANTTFNVTVPATLGDYNFKLIGGATGSFVFTSNMVTVATSCGPPTPALSINDVSVTEVDSGSSNANFTVTLSPVATGTVTVQYTTVNGTATAGSDYTTTSGTLTFAASETSKMISVPVLGDTAVEGNETFNVTLSGATGGATIADGSGTGTIVDNEILPSGLSVSPSCVVSTASRSVTVSLSGGPGHRGDWVGLFVVGAGNSSYLDWWYLNGTKTQPASGLANASFIATLPASVNNYDFRLFGGATGAVVFTSSSVQVATSCGPTSPSLSINDVSVTEGNAGSVNASFTVTLSPAASAAVTVQYQTANGTATAGSDYTDRSGTLTFNADQTTKTISVPVLGDIAVEGNETFSVNLTNATGGATIADGAGQGTAIDNDAPSGLSASPSCVVSTDRTVTVSLSGQPAHPGDWIGLFTVATGNSSYLDWWYLNGTRTMPDEGLETASFSVNMPATSGSYEFRLFGGATGSMEGTSNAVEMECGTSEAVVWANAVGVDSTDGSLLKVGDPGWTAGAVSSKVLAGAGWVEFSPGSERTTRAVGLGYRDRSQGPDDLAYGFLLDPSGTLSITEAGEVRGPSAFYSESDRLRIAIEDGAVKYYRNGDLIYESETRPDLPLRLDAALFEPGATVRDAEMGGALEVGPAPEPEGGTMYVGAVGESIQFVGRMLAGSALEYEWDFGDGSAARGSTPRHIFERPGARLVTLRVQDADGRSAKAAALVMVNP